MEREVRRREQTEKVTKPKPPLPPQLLQRCRELRQTATDAEQLLWGLIRDRQLCGAKFRRQHPGGPFILDFYCHEAKLTIELDGGVHTDPEQARRDAERAKALEAEGIRVLRFWNREVLDNTEEVLAKVKEAFTSSKFPLSPRERGLSFGHIQPYGET